MIPPNPKFNDTPSMCMLLKLDHAKFGVSNLFFKRYRKNLWLGQLDSMVKEGLIF